ncbi:MAG: ABC transporter permease [Planctomycetes bacterium]|nr:ABC transporter permease [Planctomycetota bacterium]
MMMARLFWKEHRALIFGYTGILAFAWTAGIFYWPELRDNGVLELVRFLPFEPLKDFARGFEQEGFWAYFGVQHLFRGAGMFGTGAAGLLGTGLVAREVENRTAELLLSRPISRSRIFLVRWAAGAWALLVPLLAVTVLGAFLAPQVSESLPWESALIGSVYAWLFPLAVFSLTAALSAFCSTQLKAGVLVLGFMLLQMAFYLIPELWNHSIYNWVDLDVTLAIPTQGFPWEGAWKLLGLSALFVAIGLWQFRRRDF